MIAKPSGSQGDKAGRQRHKPPSDKKIRELELAGGVEGGMEAGSAGGPSQQDAERSKAKKRPAR
jgi:hypothetical protein